MGKILENKGFLVGNKVLFVYFLVVIDVGKEDKEERMGIKKYERTSPSKKGIGPCARRVGWEATVHKNLFKNNKYFVYK
jgi:hypothetical protein